MEKKQYRHFQISCGLREGYDLSSPVHTIADVRTLIQKWLELRVREGKKVAVGALSEGEFIYPWIEGEIISSRYEPSFYYKGMIREDASDEDAWEMLSDLAKVFAEQLNQKRVHVEFCSEYILIERK